MRECGWCGKPCNSDIGVDRKEKRTYWGGSTGQKVVWLDIMTAFFCSNDHRNLFFTEP